MNFNIFHLVWIIPVSMLGGIGVIFFSISAGLLHITIGG
jgi:hypothetical protein